MLSLTLTVSANELPESAARWEEIETGGGRAYLDGTRLWLRISDAERVQGEVVIPRLAAPVRSLGWMGGSEPAPKFRPEPKEWVFSWEGSRVSSHIVIDFDRRPVLLQDEPLPVVAGDGSIMLHAYQAETHGEKLRYEPQWFKNTVGYWADASDYATWRLRVDQPGTFAVAILQGCGSGQGGSDAAMSVWQGEEVVAGMTFQTVETGHFQNFRWNHLGRVFIPRAGEYVLRLSAKRIAKGALFDVRMVHLVRAASANWPDSAKTEPSHVWLLAGQSNMQGIGKIVNLPTEVPRELGQTYFYNGSEFERLVIGQTRTSKRAGEFGPEIGFGWELAAAARTNFLIKYAASGMPLHHGFNGGKWIGGDATAGRRNFYPGKSSDDHAIGTLYGAMLQRFRSGLAAMRGAGQQPHVCGLVWMQGEQDSKQRESAESYAENLQNLRDRLAADLHLQELPLVFGQVLPYEPAKPRFKHRKQIRQQMSWADGESGDAASIPLAKMVSTDRFALLPDTVHYNASGQLELGKAMGKAMRALRSSLEKEQTEVSDR